MTHLMNSSALPLKSALLATLFAAVLVVSGTTQSSADPLVRGVQGAIGGAVIGGIVDGGKGAGRGAIIGGTLGIIGGAIEEEEARRYRKARRYRGRHYRRDVVHAPPSGLVYETQKSLTRLGYDPGPIDGVYGQRTARAIAEYQEEYDLNVTGEPSDPLLDHMHRNGG